MSQDQSAAGLLSAADPALTITEEELIHSRQRSLSFLNSEITHIAVGGSVHDFHRAPAKSHWGAFRRCRACGSSGRGLRTRRLEVSNGSGQHGGGSDRR